MVEGSRRTDRSSTRNRVNLGIEKSSSDTEIAGEDRYQPDHHRRCRRSSSAKTEKRGSKKKREKCWPFIEGLTVDGLARYRRRRAENYPRDTIVVGAFHQTASDVTNEKISPPSTEYRRAFRVINKDSFVNVIENTSKTIPSLITPQDNPISAEEVINETELIVEPELHRQGAPALMIVESSSPLPIVVDEPQQQPSAMGPTVFEKAHNREPPNNASVTDFTKQPVIVPRHGTTTSSQHRQGDEFFGNTESSCYVAHTGNHRAELARRPTSLKMEGNMAAGRSEQCDKFVEWFNVSRPELVRKPTNLKLEGDIATMTENHAQYVPFVGARRPELLRQTAHLKFDGESTYLPEYTDVFRQHQHNQEKRMPVLPENHLKTGDDLYEDTTSRIRPYGGDSMNNESLQDHQRAEEQNNPPTQRNRDNNERDMRVLVSKLGDSKGPMALLETPEYKDSYKNHPRERPKVIKPEDEIGRRRVDSSKDHANPCWMSSRTGDESNKFQTKIDQDPEYKSSFIGNRGIIGPDRGRRSTMEVYSGKPPLSVPRRPAAQNVPISCADGPFGSLNSGRDSRRSRQHEATSRARWYDAVPYCNPARPEYREVRCDHHQRGPPAIARERNSANNNRPLFNQRGCCCWNYDNDEQFGQTNAVNDQDAFQLVSRRVHEDSIDEKPEPSGPGGSRTQRIPSPARSGYRFSPAPPTDQHRETFQSSEVYSPSFGGKTTSQRQQRRMKAVNADQDAAFVVLPDNTRTVVGDCDTPFNPAAVGNGRSRKFHDRPYNINNNNYSGPGLPPARGSNRTPTNWMPPWYDNVNSVVQRSHDDADLNRSSFDPNFSQNFV